MAYIPYKKLAYALAVLALVAIGTSCYDRFVKVEAMALQSKADRIEDKEQIKDDISEIKQGISSLNDKVDTLIMKGR